MTVGRGSQLSSQAQRRRHEKKCSKRFASQQTRSNLFLHLPFGNFPRGWRDFAAVDPFFNERLHILPESLGLGADPSAHLAEAQ